ncbi:hypothetical protein QJU43_06730 [Pasteurella atlantica]|uniref:hypothetical protein n=1 Tax=Pasteurellaceae TaxID=712 RepID=UPI00276279B7|nr:hypothetical protein [Pasteurella atlantica]MDP8033853.1 hypothetical protein [Pasteurella atlantica]MDP8035788.1 hypothetical protein [Pasteurella atlantica]MDP8037677.1 hypothetical protein [Pasteurella atlantica]MDP8048089.1 hypothetical protein [Pasteurella atlantica]MDP8050112.1 hypothetical protein [Pasteurella atlantica]
MSVHQLSRREKYAIRRWFKKIDDNTLELKEQWLGPIKFIFLFMLSLAVYYDFIHPEYRAMNIHSLQFSFMPKKVLERDFHYYREDSNKLGFTREGDSKAEYIAEMWEKHKHRVWDGYGMVAYYIFLLTMILWPNKRRIRFDRKRGIIYTYAKGKLYVTEINKLVRPLHDYLDIRDPYKITIWVHPYIKTTKYFADDSRMNFCDYSMWFWGMAQRPQRGNLFLMQRFLIDFMNPDVEPERLEGMMKAVSGWRDPLEWLIRLTVGLSDNGLYCKPLPRKAFLEKELAHYFSHIAPSIKQHPSWRRKAHYDDPKEFFNVKAISDKENRRAGYSKVPCPNLFEYLTPSQLYNIWFVDRDS